MDNQDQGAAPVKVSRTCYVCGRTSEYPVFLTEQDQDGAARARCINSNLCALRLYGRGRIAIVEVSL